MMVSTNTSCLIFLALVASWLPATAFNATTLQKELASIPEEDCMSTSQLAEAVERAAWAHEGPNGTVQKAVMITTCNLKVQQKWFPPGI